MHWAVGHKRQYEAGKFQVFVLAQWAHQISTYCNSNGWLWAGIGNNCQQKPISEMISFSFLESKFTDCPVTIAQDEETR